MNIIKSSLFVSACFLMATTAKADMFGGDTVVLSQLLANALQQLVQLKQILATGKDSLDLVQDVNRGVNEALRFYETAKKNSDPRVFGDLHQAQAVVAQIRSLYGQVKDSAEAVVQKHTDDSVAEAISLNNSMFRYAGEIDKIGDEIKQQSALASPKGAERLTAQSMGVLLHVMNQNLRTQATGLKLQAQEMAVQNRKDKEFSNQVQASASSLQRALNQNTPNFALPRF